MSDSLPHQFKGRGPLPSRNRPAHSSTSAFLIASAAIAASLFFLLWWMLQEEETPWIPAGLAASVVMLVAAFARLFMVRRARSYAQSGLNRTESDVRLRRPSDRIMKSISLHAAALRTLQKQSNEADTRDVPDIHRELYDRCCEYLEAIERVVLSPGLQPDARVALRAGQDRVLELKRHHLLSWARSSAREMTREAQQRVRLYEKVEAANRALDCIDSALKVYPDEEELNVSAQAVREFITSSRVAHWVELAERAAFKGQQQRAIDCYHDALYYLSRDLPTAASEAAAERITREIHLLKLALDSDSAIEERSSPPRTIKARRSL